jgi:hypothetical protein
LTDQFPFWSALPVPTDVVPSSRVTKLFASAVPVKVGAVILVILSVLDVPLSDVAIRSGALGAAGGVLSNVTSGVA